MAGFEVVCRHDEAIDVEAMGPELRVKFRETMDVKHLVFVPGKKPARFQCRSLKVSEMRAVMTHPEMSERFVESFKRGLVRADDLHCDGERRSFTRADDRPLSDRVLDEVFQLQDVLDVGAAIFGRSMLGKGRPAAWPQPDTLPIALEARVSHLVAAIRAQDASSAQSKPLQEAPPPTTQEP